MGTGGSGIVVRDLSSGYPKRLSRRDILKLVAAGLGSLAFSRLPDGFVDTQIVRVATASVSVYSQPDDASRITGQYFRDELVNTYGQVEASEPAYNPIWYRVWGGYMHRARLQKVKILPNPVLDGIPSRGQLAEVTVPYTQSMRFTMTYRWQPLYRLYYESNHWITGLDQGPDGEAWYRLWDELVGIDYHVRAIHLRPIPDEEWTPIAPEIPAQDKRIEVDLTRQELLAFESGLPVFKTSISSGIAGSSSKKGLSTSTPRGEFHIENKYPSKHMGDGNLASDTEAYELVGVPWTSFFTMTGYAFHGTYWHDNFGVPMSRGCINMRPADARWLFRWCTPASAPVEFEIPSHADTRGYGTLVKIFYG